MSQFHIHIIPDFPFSFFLVLLKKKKKKPKQIRQKNLTACHCPIIQLSVDHKTATPKERKKENSKVTRQPTFKKQQVITTNLTANPLPPLIHKFTKASSRTQRPHFLPLFFGRGGGVISLVLFAGGAGIATPLLGGLPTLLFPAAAALSFTFFFSC